MPEYVWRIGDVFTNGKYRWSVVSVTGDLAVLQSCDTSWARTRLLTFDEWSDGGKWQLEQQSKVIAPSGGQ
jgi:hypothetical protein